MRIKPEFQGQGLNRTILQFVFTYIKTEFQAKKNILLSSSKPAWPSQIHGRQDDDYPDRLNRIREAEEKYLKGSSTRTVIGTRKWICRFKRDLQQDCCGKPISSFCIELLPTVVQITRMEAIEIMISKRFELKTIAYNTVLFCPRKIPRRPELINCLFSSRDYWYQTTGTTSGTHSTTMSVY